MKNVLKTDKLGFHKKLVLTVGLPYSGKSTMAHSLDCPVVCPDAIRVALHGQRFLKESEPMVWTLARYMVKSLFLAGHGMVVLDATNLTDARRKEWESDDWQVRYVIVDTTKETCIQRALQAGDEDIVPIIEKMAETMTWPTVAAEVI